MIANRSAQHGEAIFQCVEDGALSDGAGEFQMNVAFDLG
jgi:hypothetical protein